MRYLSIALVVFLFSGCVQTGITHRTCLIGISAPFVFVGINGKPLGWCRKDNDFDIGKCVNRMLDDKLMTDDEMNFAIKGCLETFESLQDEMY